MGLSDFVPKFLDPYDRQARLYPGLLVFLPLAVLVVCLYGTNNVAGSSVLSILSLCGSAYALGRIARDAGKRIQDDLFGKWGGAPTTQLLRHRDTRIDTHTKARFHAVVAKGIGQTFPTAAGEQSDPRAADELYRAATTWLINQTRDTKVHPLVFKENIAFGFHRNALGLRPLGLCVAVLCIVWVLIHSNTLMFTSPYLALHQFLRLEPNSLIALGISVVMMSVWVFWLTESALHRAGFSYAERLLQSCDGLKPVRRSTKKATV